MEYLNLVNVLYIKLLHNVKYFVVIYIFYYYKEDISIRKNFCMTLYIGS